MPSTVARRLLPLALGLASAGLCAAPVPGDTVAPAAHELALRWTLDNLATMAGGWPAVETTPASPASPVEWPLPVAAALPDRPAAPMAQRVPLTPGNVPDPGAYALMGLALLGAAGVVRMLTRRPPVQRGLSKNT